MGPYETRDNEHAMDLDGAFPEPYNDWFNQIERRPSLCDEDSGIEVDAEETTKPVDKSSPPQPPLQCSTSVFSSTTGTGVSANSLDLFGSYLQDYKQSDYNRSLFDENMLLR